MQSGACKLQLFSLERNLRFRSKEIFVLGPLILRQSTTLLALLVVLRMKKIKGKMRKIICGAFINYFPLVFFSPRTRLNLVKLTRGVYQTHNLKFGAFCRLWLAGKRRPFATQNEIYFEYKHIGLFFAAAQSLNLKHSRVHKSHQQQQQNTSPARPLRN